MQLSACARFSFFARDCYRIEVGVRRISDFVNLAAKPRLFVIGLMSGMSADGVDLALTSIEGTFPDLQVELLGSWYRPYSADLKADILRAQVGGTAEVSKLNFVIAEEFSKCVTEFLHHKGLAVSDIDLIGSHGQTLFHSTGTTESVPSSLQVGSPSLIAERTGIPTIGNFRVRDIVAGGQGAPLVAMAEYILFHKKHKVVILNNLGSISNVSVVTEHLEQMLAFDTGPANMPIDFFAKRVPGNSNGIDHSGHISATGQVIVPLLNDLMASAFYDKSPPKAAGYAEFGPTMLEPLLEKYCGYQIEDFVRTSVEFSALTLAQAYRKFVLPKFPNPAQVLFSGGGVCNITLMTRIRELLPELRIETFEEEFAAAKEAVCFAILAHLTVHGHPGNVVSVTGANRPVVLGEIAI